MAKNPLTEKLRPHAADTQAAAASGDAKASDVITLYGMHCYYLRDPGAFALFDAAFDQ